MTSTSLIDSHCHLDFEVFDNDREQVLKRARKRRIKDIIIPGTQRIYWPRIKELCKTNKNLHACYGMHPYWAKTHQNKDINSLSDFIDSNKTVAIGECGLDFRKQHADKKVQLHFLHAQLEMANSKNLPIVLHAVNATESIIQTIKTYKNLSGMIHSYSGSSEQARQLLDLNFMISASGNVTFNNAKKIKQVIKDIPLTSLLIETDSPDQADQSNLGKRNEPAHLVNTVTAIAALKRIPEDIIAKQTTANAKKLFGI